MTYWRPNNRVTFKKWRDCDMCGIPWPLEKLRPQRGMLVCPEDIDEKCHEDYMREQPEEGIETDLSSVWEKES